MTSSHPLRRLGLLLALALPLVLTACDSTGSGGDTFFLPERSVDFEFTFDANDLSPTAFTDFTTTDSENLVAYIENEGFSISDVVSARIQEGSGEIELLQPPFEDISFLDAVRIELLQGTRPALTVASLSDFPASGDRADLEIPSADFADFAVTGPFSALLGVRAEPRDETYRVRVSFDVVIEVEAGAARPAL